MKKTLLVFILLVGQSVMVEKIWAAPCMVQSDQDRYTLDQDDPEYTLRDYLWIVNQAWRKESRDGYGNRLVNPYYDFCRDGTNERGKAIRRLVLTHSRYRIEKSLPPVVAGEGETLILESGVSSRRAVLEGDRLRGRDSDCGLYLGLDANRLWREATEGQNTGPNPQVLAEWEETLSGDNIILRNISLKTFPQHALCVAASHVQIRGMDFLYNEGAGVFVHEEASDMEWEENRMWQNKLGGIVSEGRTSSKQPVVEDIFEEADSWRVVGHVPDRVATPYLLQIYLQNPDPAQTHSEGVFLIDSKEFSSRRFEIFIPKGRGRSWPSYIQLGFDPDVTFHLRRFESSRYYPFTLLVIDRNGKLSGFSDPFRPDDYLGCSSCFEKVPDNAEDPEPKEPVIPEEPEPPPAPPEPPAPEDSDTDEISEEEDAPEEDAPKEEVEELYTSTSCQIHPAAAPPNDFWGWALLCLLVIVCRRQIKDPGG